MIGANVSKQSMPCICLSPLAQNHAFNLLTAPSGYHLYQKAHVLGKTFIQLSLLVTSQDFILVINVCNSFLQASQYPWEFGLFIA